MLPDEIAQGRDFELLGTGQQQWKLQVKRQYLDIVRDPSLLRGSFGGVAVVLANLTASA
jgi:hypothetical protein